MSGTSNYSPYEPNAKGFTEALIDLKDTLSITVNTRNLGGDLFQ